MRLFTDDERYDVANRSLDAPIASASIFNALGDQLRA